MHGEAKTLLALLQLAQRPAAGIALRDILECPLDGGHQARPIVLEHVIDRTLAQRLQRPLFADGSRYENERGVGPLPPRDLQCEGSVEAGQGVIRQDQIGGEILERGLIADLVLDPPTVHVQAAAAHLAHQQFGILRTILHEQHFYRASHIRNVHRGLSSRWEAGSSRPNTGQPVIPRP